MRNFFRVLTVASIALLLPGAAAAQSGLDAYKQSPPTVGGGNEPGGDGGGAEGGGGGGGPEASPGSSSVPSVAGEVGGSRSSPMAASSGPPSRAGGDYRASEAGYQHDEGRSGGSPFVDAGAGPASLITGLGYGALASLTEGSSGAKTASGGGGDPGVGVIAAVIIGVTALGAIGLLLFRRLRMRQPETA